jgi:transcriptional regulator
MYTQKHNREDDRAKLYSFMKEYSFATLVTSHDGVPKATHLPFLVETNTDALRLRAHMAKANDQWRDFSDTKELLVIFQEPHAYVSPKHYEQHLSVPTWNYVAVHAYGHARIMDAPEDKLRLLERMIRHLDEGYLTQWDGLPEQFKKEKMSGIVAFEIDVTRLQGRFKLSQDRTATEQQTIADEFCASSDSAISKIGEMMRENLKR